MNFKAIWENIRQSKTFIPTRINIPANHTDKGEALQEPFEDNKHYFVVRINEMFLPYKRLWYKNYDPIVFAVSEFMYDGKRVEVPYMVGPSMLKNYMDKIPEGMLFTNTRVAGIHPYKGDKLSLTLILCRVETSDYARKLLDVIEGTANTLDFSNTLSGYLKVGKVVLNGLSSLFDLGDTVPIIGMRNEIDPDAGDVFQAGYFALINAPEDQLDHSKFWVKNNSLYYGSSMQSAQPYREADYILYSINQNTRRSDEEALSFFDSWKEIQDYIGKQTGIEEKEKLFIKAKMFGLYYAIHSSPDLTNTQARALFKQYKEKVDQMQEDLMHLGDILAAPKSSDTEDPREAKMRAEALDLLK